jgi:hypothetical protein
MKKIIILVLLLISFNAIGQSKKSVLNQVMSAETIGVQVAYIEQIAGPAKRVNGSLREYSINDCRVIIVEDKDKSIRTIEIYTQQEKCDFDTGYIGLSGLASKLMFKDVIGMGGRWLPYVDCYGLCGNFREPVLGVFVEHQNTMRRGLNYSVLGKAGTLEFLNRLQATFPEVDWMSHKQTLTLDPSVPVKGFSDLWYAQFKNVKIHSIKFGYDSFNTMRPSF